MVDEVFFVDITAGILGVNVVFAMILTMAILYIVFCLFYFSLKKEVNYGK